MAIAVTSPFGTLTGLECISSNEGKTNTNFEIPDSCGSIVLAETIETVERPTATYNVISAFDLSAITLGELLSGAVPVSVQVTTAAGQPPQITITGEDVNGKTIVDATTTVSLAGTVDPDMCAQAFGSLPASTATCHLQSCTATWSVDLKRINGNDGKIEAFGVAKGRLEASGEYQATDTSTPAAPSPTATLVITTPVTKSEDTTTLPKYTLATTTYL